MLGDGDQLKGFFEISSLSKNDSHLISSAGKTYFLIFFLRTFTSGKISRPRFLQK